MEYPNQYNNPKQYKYHVLFIKAVGKCTAFQVFDDDRVNKYLYGRFGLIGVLETLRRRDALLEAYCPLDEYQTWYINSNRGEEVIGSSLIQVPIEYVV